MTKAAWYFDFISPFSYLQLGRFQDLPQDLEIALKPVVFPALLNHWGHMGPAEIPPKRQFVYRFFRWQAIQRGMPFTMPPVHPFNPLPPLRLALLGGSTPEVVRGIFNFIYGEGRNLEDETSITGLGASLGVSKARAGRTYAVVNKHQQPTGAFTKNPDWQFPGEEMIQVIRDAVGERAIFIDATAIATALLGDSIAANLFMLGLSYQRGLIPIGEVAINRAIELNGVAVAANKKAFEWGRHAAVDEAKVRSIAQPNSAAIQQFPPSLDQEIHDRVRELTSYQNAAYARQYLDLVARVRAAEQRLAKGIRLASAVSRYYFKLMAYKDEYEVARLFTDGRFKERLAAQFDGEVSLRFNLAPPLFAKRDADGHLIKREYSPWIWHAFRVLTKLKFLRGTPFDPFGSTAERRIERQLISEYRGDVEELLEHLNETNLAEAVELASWPEFVRGYGHVKDASLSAIRAKRNTKQKSEIAQVLDRRTG